MFKTVLFPIDRSRETQEAAHVVVEIVQKYDSRLVLLSVVEASEDAGEGMESPDVVAQLLGDAQSLFKQHHKMSFFLCQVFFELSKCF